MNPNVNAGKTAGYHSHPASFKVNKFNLFPHKAKLKNGKKSINIINIMQSFSIQESLSQNSIILTTRILDGTNLLEVFKINGGEKCEVEIQQKFKDGEDNEVDKKIKLELYIVEILNFSRPNIGSATYDIVFMTKEGYRNQFLTINRPFKGNAVEEIKAILEGDLGAEPKKDDSLLGKAREGAGVKGDITDKWTKSVGHQLRGYYPKLKPFDAIQWLVRSSFNDKSPLFFGESLRDGYILKGLDEMYKQDSYSGYTNLPYLITTGEPGKDQYNNERQMILDYSVSSYASTLSRADGGGYGSLTTWVDFSEKKKGTEKYIDSEQRTKMNEKKASYTGDLSVFKGSKKLNRRERAETAQFFFINENSKAYDKGIKDNYHSQVRRNVGTSFSYLENLNATNANITLNGDPALGIGDVIHLVLANETKASNEDITEQSQNILFGGKYLVKSIRHNFTERGYSMEVDIGKRDSLADFDKEVDLSKGD